MGRHKRKERRVQRNRQVEDANPSLMLQNEVTQWNCRRRFLAREEPNNSRSATETDKGEGFAALSQPLMLKLRAEFLLSLLLSILLKVEA